MTLIRLVDQLFTIYTWIVLARVILSWIPTDPYNPLVRFIYRITEPVLRPVRGVLPTVGGLDFSPLVVLFGLNLVRRLVVSLLWDLLRI